MNTRAKLVFAVVLLVVLPGGLVLSRYFQGGSQTSHTDTLRWQIGTSQQYQVETNSQVQMATVKTGTAQTLHIQLQGVLDMQTLDASPDSATVGMRFETVDLVMGGKTNPDTNKALRTPFRVRFIAGGIPAAFEFPSGISAKNRIILQNLIRMFQVTMHSGKTWTAQEADASGHYEAVYTRTSAQAIVKTKHDLAGVKKSAFLKDSVFQSKGEIRVDDRHDWITQMSLAETRKTNNLSDFNLKIVNHARITLTSANAQLSNTAWDFVASAVPAGEAQTQTDPKLTPAEARRQLSSVLDSLNAANQDRIIWIHRLRDLLRADNSLPDALLDELRHRHLTDRAQADVFLALEEAGNTAAQQALVSVMSDPSWPQADAMRAVIALAGIKNPTPDTVSALWQTADSSQLHGDRHQLVSTATYALGSIGAAMNAANNPDYSALKAQLEQAALTASGGSDDIEIRTNYVNALGNTRDASLTGDLVTLLGDDAPSVRRAAAESLNTIGVDQAAPELMSRFQQEKNRAVRSAMMESLVNWSNPTPSAVASIAAEVRSEPSESTRYYMAQFLGNNLDQYPANRQVLQDLLRTEVSKRIRQSVADALANAKKQQ
jgi:HEAT repeat protein